MSLRDEIAQHLADSWGKRPDFTPTKIPLDRFSPGYRDHYLNLADHVIRLMHWAQSQVYAVPGGPPDVTAALPLSLPQPDWQPNNIQPDPATEVTPPENRDT